MHDSTDPLDLTLLLLLGLSVFYAAVLVRAFPWPAAWTLRKPLSCNACMSGWSAIFHGVWTVRSLPEAIPFIAAAGVAYLLLVVCDKLSRDSWPSPPA